MSAEVWPPPANERTVWETMWVREGYARGHEVAVRPVLLWGQVVKINAEGEVWCPACQRFKTTAQLSHPWNPCPVGLPHRGGMLPLYADPSAPDFDDESPADPLGFGRWSW